jgi:hypothetical protein
MMGAAMEWWFNIYKPSAAVPASGYPTESRWLGMVNLPMEEAETKMVKDPIERSRPVGSESWIRRTSIVLHRLRPAADWKDGENRPKLRWEMNNGLRHL